MRRPCHPEHSEGRRMRSYDAAGFRDNRPGSFTSLRMITLPYCTSHLSPLSHFSLLTYFPPMPKLQVTTPEALPEETSADAALRPSRLDEFVGQAQVKASLQIAIDAARQRRETLDH